MGSLGKNWKEIAAAAALGVVYLFAKDPRFLAFVADAFFGVTIALIAIVYFFKKVN